MSGNKKTSISNVQEDDNASDTKLKSGRKMENLLNPSSSFDSSAKQLDSLHGINSSDEATSGGVSISTAVALEKIAGIDSKEIGSSFSSSTSEKHGPPIHQPFLREASLSHGTTTGMAAYYHAPSDMMDARFYRQPSVPPFSHPHYRYPPPPPFPPHLIFQSNDKGKAMTSFYQEPTPTPHHSRHMTSKALDEKQLPSGGKRPRGRPKGSTNKGKPKRPLSAYNIFFKEERARILESIPDAEKAKSSRKHRKSLSTGSSSGETPDMKRGGKQPHGKIGFENLAKMIASRWQSLSPEELEPYTSRAKVEAERYKKELELCKTKEEEDVKKVKTKGDFHLITCIEPTASTQYYYEMNDTLPRSSQDILAAPEQSVYSSSSYVHKYKSPPRSASQAKARLATINLDDKEESEKHDSQENWIAPAMSPIRFNPTVSSSSSLTNTALKNAPSSGAALDISLRKASTSTEGNILVLGEKVKSKTSFVLGQSGYSHSEERPSSTLMRSPPPSAHLDSSFAGLFHDAGATFFDSPTNSNDEDN